MAHSHESEWAMAGGCHMNVKEIREWAEELRGFRYFDPNAPDGEDWPICRILILDGVGNYINYRWVYHDVGVERTVDECLNRGDKILAWIFPTNIVYVEELGIE